MPFLVLYKALSLLDTRLGLILLYTLTVLPIVIWIMRDQFNSIPIELDEAAFVDGLSIWGAFFRIVLPLAVPGMAAAFILSLVLCWNEYFFAALLTQYGCQNPARHGGQPDRLARHQLVVHGGAINGGDRSARDCRNFPRALHRQWFDRRRRQVGDRGTEWRIPNLFLSASWLLFRFILNARRVSAAMSGEAELPSLAKPRSGACDWSAGQVWTWRQSPDRLPRE